MQGLQGTAARIGSFSLECVIIESSYSHTGRPGTPARHDMTHKEVDPVMNRTIIYLLLTALCFTAFACTSDTDDEGKLLARINDRNLALDEFERQLAAEIELNRDLKLTKQVKREFLEDIIRKEILIQEAKRLQLDREQKFVRAIQRYWEATLIRDLMEMKGDQISKEILVSQEEIEARYGDMQKSGGAQPSLLELQDKIIDDIKEEKKTEKLKAWIDDLRGSSSVWINEEILYKD